MADSLLYDTAAAVLFHARDGLDVDRIPSRCYVPSGPDFAHDCHQLTVHFVRLYVARRPERGAGADRPTARRGTRPGIRMAEFTVTLVDDCIPVSDTAGNPPSVDRSNDAAAMVLTDGLDVRNSLYDAIRDGSLFAARVEDDVEIPALPYSSCDGVELGDLSPFGPSGRVAGVRLPLLVELP